MRLIARTLLLIFLMNSVAYAEVRDTYKYEPCFKTCTAFPDWEKFVLVDEDTLLQLKKDADGFKKYFPELQAIQDEMNLKILEFNDLRIQFFSAQTKVAELERDKFMLEHPPWYKQTIPTLAVGGAVGATFATVVLLIILFYTGTLGR